MTVESIKRDWGPNISIVRLVTDSPVEDVVQTGWLGAQAADIADVNNGVFEWKPNDVVLIDFDVGVNFFYVFAGYNSVNPMAPLYPNTQDIVAHAGGGQANAEQLNIGINVVTTVATAADSVKLPTDVLGQTVIVTNRAANSLNVFPATGDQINALGANNPLAVAAGATTVFYGTGVANWNSK